MALKRNAKVMLVKNISDALVNGLQGQVKELLDDSICIHFPQIPEPVNLHKENFEIQTEEQSATRVQIPVKLAYATTIQKSQGMTLEHVEVECQHIFQAGQLAVAVSRSKTAGLRILQCNPNPNPLAYFRDLTASHCGGKICCYGEMLKLPDLH